MTQQDFVFETLRQVAEALIAKIVNAQSVDEAEKALDLLMKTLDRMSERERQQKVELMKDQAKGR